MLHQTLLSFQPFSPSSLHNSLPSPSASAAHLASPQAEMKLSASDQAFLADQETEDLAWDRTNLLCEDFHVEDLLDLRALSEFEENEEPPTVTEPNLPPPKSPLCAQNNPLELFSEISLQDADAASLEWLSRFFDDISKEFPSPSPPPLPNQNPQPKYHSLGSRAPARVKSKRSKRLRGSSAVWARSSSLKLADYSSASSITSLTASSPTRSSSSSSSFSSSFNSYEASHEQKKRGRKRKNAFFSQAERRCTHCGVHKTPQWRAGPQGAKTLCNACGVRYKSGRLLPEYRPACSPTFVGSIHSNSHRKVLEMRRKNDEQIGLAQPARAVSSC